MTQEETLEYNRRCAEFLGWTNLNDESFPEYLDKFGNFYPFKELQFDSDWNWIMIVIEAIEKLGFNFDSYNPIDIGKDGFYEFNIWNRINPEIEGRGNTIKEAYINAINQFLIYKDQI